MRKSLNYIIAACFVFGICHKSDAQILRDVPIDKLPPDLSIDSTSADGSFRFFSLEQLYSNYAPYYDFSNLRNPYYVRSHFWGLPWIDNRYSSSSYNDSDTIVYWDASAICCEENYGIGSQGDYFKIPQQINRNGNVYDIIYYFYDWQHDAPRKFKKYEIPNTTKRLIVSICLIIEGSSYHMEGPWVIADLYKLECDTLVVGTSLENLEPKAYAGCKYLFFRGGIPRFRTALNQYYDNRSSLNTFNTMMFSSQAFWNWNTDWYYDLTNRQIDKYVNYEKRKAYEPGTVQFKWKEVHVPKGFSAYYETGVDSIDKLIIDDMPVTQCNEIEIQRRRYIWQKTEKNSLVPYYFLENISGTSVTLENSDSLYIQVLCEPMDATVRYFAKLSSSDESVATIDSSGMIRTHSEGRAVITAEALDGSGVTSRLTIDVVPYTGISYPSDSSGSYPQAIYSIEGIRQSLPPDQLKRGLYIINGKKVLIK